MSVPLQRRRSHQTLLDGASAFAPSAAPYRKDRLELSVGHARSPKLPQDPFKALNRRLPRALQVGRNWATLAAAAACACLWILARRLLYPPFVPPKAPCFDLAHPGRLLINLTSPLHTHWRPLDEDACPALPLYLPALWKLSKGPDTPYPSFTVQSYSNDYQLVAGEPLERHPAGPTSKAKPAAKLKPGELAPVVPEADPVEFLRKRRAGPPPTVLIIGDSVDRNGLVHFCQLMDQQVVISLYDDIKARPDPPVGDLTRAHGPRFRGWDQRGLPHLCEIALHGATGKSKVAMRVVNGFQYGMDALDEFDTPDHLDWHKPGRIETRIDELFVPLLDQMGGADSVDLIILHSGMWDLALFGLQDDKTKWSLTVPLTPEQLAWWQERMRRTIYHVRKTFPKSRIVFRKLHRTDDVVAGTQYITNCEYTNCDTFKRKLRASRTFRHFGRIFEGYQIFQEKVHPLLLPGGLIYGQNLMHQLRLALEGHKL